MPTSVSMSIPIAHLVEQGAKYTKIMGVTPREHTLGTNDTGFSWPWKSWKSHDILKSHFPGLEKSCNSVNSLKVLGKL